MTSIVTNKFENQIDDIQNKQILSSMKCVVLKIFKDGKTCSVVYNKYVKHSLYGKRMKRQKKFLCDLPSVDLVKIGDVVMIKYKKVSKKKNFEVYKVLV